MKKINLKLFTVCSAIPLLIIPVIVVLLKWSLPYSTVFVILMGIATANIYGVFSKKA